MYKRTHVFSAACIALLLFGIMLITLGSILPSLTVRYESHGLDKSLLVSILPVGILLGSLVFGPVVDRYGYKLLLITSILISSLAFQGLAFTQSVTLLYVSVFLIGFGGGIINGGTNALVADVSSGNKGASLSLLGVFFGIGALGMPLLLGTLSGNFDYESVLSGVGFFMLLPSVCFLFVVFPSPKQVQGFPLKEGVALLKEPALLLIGLFLFFQSGIESLSNNWITTFLQQQLTISNEKSLYALSFSVVSLTIARLLLGSLLKKISSFSVMLASLVLVTAGCAILLFGKVNAVAFVALMLIGLGLAAGFPVLLGYAGQLYPNLSGTAFSFVLVIALTGNTLLNYFFGFISVRYGTYYLPVVIMGCIFCMFLLLFVIRRKISDKINL